MTDDRLDERLDREARAYHEPPETPREEIWARIQAARQAGPRQAPQGKVVAFPAERTRPWLRSGLALAAVLLLGLAIGRWTPRVPDATPDETTTASAERSSAVIRFAAVEHLSQVDALLTDYATGQTNETFRATTRALLSRTRLLLDSKRLTDPSIRKLLEDLEVLLMQVAQLPGTGPAEERALIDENLAEQAIRPRLRNAIPSGPAA